MTEQQIAEALEGRFFAVVNTDFGCVVIDRNEVKIGGKFHHGHKAKPIVRKPYVVGSDWVDTTTGQLLETYTMKSIAAAVCAVTGVAHDDFISGHRSGRIIRARKLFYWIAKRHTPHSFGTLAKFSGRGNHATALHGVKTVNASIDRFSDDIKKAVELLRTTNNRPIIVDVGGNG